MKRNDDGLDFIICIKALAQIMLILPYILIFLFVYTSSRNWQCSFVLLLFLHILGFYDNSIFLFGLY